MPCDMLGQKGRDEIVGMVVAILHPYFRMHPRLCTCERQNAGLELFFEELVGGALTYKDMVVPRAVLDQGNGIVFVPGRPVFAQIAGEGLLAPRHSRGCHDQSKRTDRTEAIRIAQADGERAVAAHRMAGDRLAREIDRELALDQSGQFVLDIAAHPVMLRPRFLRRIDIHARTLAEIVLVLGIGHVGPARAGVARDEDPVGTTRANALAGTRRPIG